MMDPIDTSTEPFLLRLLQDEKRPVGRRVLVDHTFWQRPDRAFSYSEERMSLLKKLAAAAKSPEEVKYLARDLRSFGDAAPEFWTAHPQPTKRAIGLTELVTAIWDNPNASVSAKWDAALALSASAATGARSEVFGALVRLAKRSEGPTDAAVSQIGSLAPFRPEEAEQVREMLKQGVNDPGGRLKEAVARPREQ
jgi:hypothetical protein